MPDTYYVSTTGDNADAGSEAAPWADLSHAIGEVVTGDTIRIKDGNYVDNNLIVLDDLIDNLTITSDSEDKTKVSITNTVHQYWFDLQKGSTGTVIKDLTFNQLSTAGTYSVLFRGYIGGSGTYAQATFQDCNLNSAEYTFQNFGAGTIIQRCHIHNTGTAPGTTYRIGVVLMGTSGPVTIDSCLFTNHKRSIIADEDGCIIRNCTIISHGPTVTYDGDDGIGQANDNHQVLNTIIYSYETGSYQGFKYGIDFSSDASNQGRMCIAAGVYGSDFYDGEGAPVVTEQLETQVEVTNNFAGKLFVDLAGGDFHPDPAGAAYQRGYATSFPVTDLNGNPFNNPPSIGCLEDPPAAGGGVRGEAPRVNNLNNLNNLKL